MFNSTKLFFSRIFTRNFRRSPVVRDDCISDCGGLPGSNLPFNIQTNRYKLTAHFLWFFGVGLASPALLFRHLLLKNAGDGPASTAEKEEDEGDDDNE